MSSSKNKLQRKNITNNSNKTIQTEKVLNGSGYDKSNEIDFLYNDYLQALLKENVVSELIKENEKLLYKQILYQKNNLLKLNIKLYVYKQEVVELNKKPDILKMLHSIEEETKKLFSCCDQLLSEGLLENFKDSLDSARQSTILLVNVTNPSDQNDINELFKQIELSNSSILKSLNVHHQYLTKIEKLGTEDINHLIKLKKTVKKAYEIFKDNRYLVSSNYFAGLSDGFAEKQGYS